MPQMAPMLWLILFFYFVILFMLFITNFYFTFSPSTLGSAAQGNLKTSSLSWMW